MFFFLVLLADRRIRIREAQKHVDPVDPDPEHWSPVELTDWRGGGEAVNEEPNRKTTRNPGPL
jgi:hypothetical protein